MKSNEVTDNVSRTIITLFILFTAVYVGSAGITLDDATSGLDKILCSSGSCNFFGSDVTNVTNINGTNASFSLYDIYLGIVKIGSIVDGYGCDASYCIYQPWYAPGQVYAKNGSTGRVDYFGNVGSTVFNSALSASSVDSIVYASGYFNITAGINVLAGKHLRVDGTINTTGANGIVLYDDAVLDGRLLINSNNVTNAKGVFILGNRTVVDGISTNGTQYAGIEIQDRNDNTVRNVNVTYSTIRGIDIRSGRGNTISNFRVSEIWNGGTLGDAVTITVSSVGTTSASGNKISDGIITGNIANGISFFGGGNSVSSVNNNTVEDVLILDAIVRDIAAFLFDNNSRDNTGYNLVSINSTKRGIRFNGGPTTNNRVDGCVISYPSLTGIDFNATNNTVTNCDISFSNRSGVVIGGANSVIKNSKIRNSGQGNDASEYNRAGIYLAGNYSTVTGNNIFDDQIIKTQSGSLFVTTGIHDNYIVDNKFGNGTVNYVSGWTNQGVATNNYGMAGFNHGVVAATSNATRPSAFGAGDTYRNGTKYWKDLCVSIAAGTDGWYYDGNQSGGC